MKREKLIYSLFVVQPIVFIGVKVGYDPSTVTLTQVTYAVLPIRQKLDKKCYGI